MERPFVAILRHNSRAEIYVRVRKTYAEAVEEVHNHFLSYDFEVKNGQPYDPNYNDGTERHNGFNCFSGVKMHDGKVAEYMHCSGEGPVAEIMQSGCDF